MWKNIIDVPRNIDAVTWITNPFNIEEGIWVEVCLSSCIPGVLVFAPNQESLQNIILINDDSTDFLIGSTEECPFCHQQTEETCSISIQYNYDEWNTFHGVCNQCRLSMAVEVVDDSKNVTGFQVNNE